MQAGQAYLSPRMIPKAESPMKNRTLAALLAVCVLVAVLALISHGGILAIPPVALMTLRWIAIALLAAYATARRS